MISGYLPFWGASLLLHLEGRERILFVPVIEPQDHIPAGLIIREYPWGSSDCANPFSVLIENIRAELKRAGVDSSRVGMLHGAARTSLPIQAAEHPPIPDTFREQLSAITAKPDTEVDTAFLDLYLRKNPEEKIGRAHV